FVQDVGGEILESIPGRIRVRLGGRGCSYAGGSNGPLAWVGLGRKLGLVEMDLFLQRADGERNNLLKITVSMRSPQANPSVNPQWRARCEQIYCDLRGYLMGTSGSVSD